MSAKTSKHPTVNCHRSASGSEDMDIRSQLTNFPVVELELEGLSWAVLKDLQGEESISSELPACLLGVAVGGLREIAAAE